MGSVPSIRTPALVLRKFEYGETSQVLHLLTRDRVRVHVLAKGSLKPKSPFLGPLDVLETGQARLYPKKGGLSILSGFERGTNFRAWLFKIMRNLFIRSAVEHCINNRVGDHTLLLSVENVR